MKHNNKNWHPEVDDRESKPSKLIVFDEDGNYGGVSPYCWVSSVQNAPWEIFNTDTFALGNYHLKGFKTDKNFIIYDVNSNNFKKVAEISAKDIGNDRRVKEAINR